MQEDNSANKTQDATAPGGASSSTGSGGDDSEYIQQKLAEIAALKSQYKRVEDMINTTNKIEQHLSSKTQETSSVDVSATRLKSMLAGSEEAKSGASSSTATSASSAKAGAPQRDPREIKQELLGALCDMFAGFSNNLRDEAESLRTERERIKALKEEMLRRRREREEEREREGEEDD